MALGYSGATLEDVYLGSKGLRPWSKPKTFHLREIPTPDDLAKLMQRINRKRVKTICSYARDGRAITIMCAERGWLGR